MQEEADIEVEETEDSTAETNEQELTIPKHRFDAVAAELRRVREENRHQSEALRQLQTSLIPQRREDEEEIDQTELEQLGLDPRQVKFLSKMFEKKLEKKAKTYEQNTRNLIGGLATQVEEKGFVAEYGKDAQKYLPKIQQMRREHAAQGSYLSVEMAYKLIIADETLSRPAKPAKKPVQNDDEGKSAKVEPAKTQTKTSSAGKSIEDWENELDAQIKGGPGRI